MAAPEAGRDGPVQAQDGAARRQPRALRFLRAGRRRGGDRRGGVASRRTGGMGSHRGALHRAAASAAPAPRPAPPDGSMKPEALQFLAAGLFAVALAHTFATRYFERLAHANGPHAGVWKLLGEVEVVFGFWAMALVLAMMALLGRGHATDYLDSRDFREPLFVFAIM